MYCTMLTMLNRYEYNAILSNHLILFGDKGTGLHDVRVYRLQRLVVGVDIPAITRCHSPCYTAQRCCGLHAADVADDEQAQQVDRVHDRHAAFWRRHMPLVGKAV